MVANFSPKNPKFLQISMLAVLIIHIPVWLRNFNIKDSSYFALCRCNKPYQGWFLVATPEDSERGTSQLRECNLKLALALGVLNDCFNPVKDRQTKIDMLHQAVYSLGSEFKRLS